MKPGDDPSAAEVDAIFAQNIRVGLIDLKTGAKAELPGIDPVAYDQRKVAQRHRAVARRATERRGTRAPAERRRRLLRRAARADRSSRSCCPIEGAGMWGQLAGFIALDRDGNTVRGLTFYDQKETPGLGGEISNPKWQALWQGRRAYDANWEPKLTVIKGKAGTPQQDPHRIDGLSGATITSNGVARLIALLVLGPGLRSLPQAVPQAVRRLTRTLRWPLPTH